MLFQKLSTISYIGIFLLPAAFCNADEIAAQNDMIKNRRLMCAYVLQMRTNHEGLEDKDLLPALDLAGALEASLDAAHAKDTLIKRIAYQAWRSRHMNGHLPLPSYLQALKVLSDEMIHDLVIAYTKGKTERVLTQKAHEIQQRETVIAHLWSKLSN